MAMQIENSGIACAALYRPLNNPFLNSFTQQNQNIDLNRPINDNDYQIYASGIEQLRNMGFYNNIHNINSLKYTNNNIDEAVNILINL